MPQITVDHSKHLSFDREAFARDLHAAVVEIAAAKPEGCKTRFRSVEVTAVGYDDPLDLGHGVVHVTLALLAGRTDETKARLTEAVLELLRKHIEDDGSGVLHGSAEVRDLDPSYRTFER
ncbi:isomerase [Streptomyces sp. NPDC005648]|uniref:5-carboxymethyl-2-hydroxymuconate Delta-isomerase n=1 Tax=Streptomyces sp. NPDC005648 TaxID=3157044 RepID=UPI0033B7B685